MSLDQNIYGSTDWHLPSPSSTPKSVTFPDSTFKTPKVEAAHHSHFLDAWSTPRVNGQHTPAQTPSFAISTPIERPSSSYKQVVRSPEDPDFHVNHFASHHLPLPPVDPSRRLSSSPDPGKDGERSRVDPSAYPRPVSMDTSQMQTPPPTRDSSRRNVQQQHGATEFSTPATVVPGTPLQVQTNEGLFNQTPFGFPSLQFTPDMVQFPTTGHMSAPALPQTRLFWDQPNDMSRMEVDMPMSDPFGPTPFKHEATIHWQSFHTPSTAHQMNPQAFQALHGMSSPGPVPAFPTGSAGIGDQINSRSNSFISTSAGVDPSMLFSFSSPGPANSFSNPLQPAHATFDGRQPYETQVRESLREREIAKKTKSQHSRTNTSSSTASLENRPALQRSNTDSGFRRSRPGSTETKSSIASNIPRRSSPLKRQSGGSLTSIPEIRRPRTRLIIDENGRARTETVTTAEDDTDIQPDSRRDSQKDVRRQYPGLWADDESDSEPEDPPPTISRNTSFNIPQRRPSKHARTDSGSLDRSNSFKMPRPALGVLDKTSFETVRPIKKSGENSFRRFSMMDFPTSFNDPKENEDLQMPDSPGDALGALKKVVGDRQKRIDRSSQNTLKAHNQRWAQASAELNSSASPSGLSMPLNFFNASPTATTDAGLTTPSTDRSSISGDSTRCVCNTADDGQPMIQCESCNKWLHMNCVGLHNQNVPPVYVCVFCTGSTPVVRGGRVRGPLPSFNDSPLTHKSVFRR